MHAGAMCAQLLSNAALAASSLFVITWMFSVQHSMAAAAAADADVFRCYQANVGGKPPPPQQQHQQ